MKNSMKKSIALLLAIVLLLGISACSANKNGTDDEKRAPETFQYENTAETNSDTFVDNTINSDLSAPHQDNNSSKTYNVSLKLDSTR